MPPIPPAIRVLIAAGYLAALAASAAAEEEPSKLYAGAGLAVTDFNSKHEGVGYGATPLGWQFYGGWQVRDLVALEAAVERLSRIDVGDVRGSGLQRLRISSEDTSVTVRGVFSLSLQEVLRRRQNITLFGTAGLARSLERRGVLELNTAQAVSVSERDWALVIGAGVTFDVARLRLRTYLQTEDRAAGTLNSVGVGAEFRF